MHFFKILRWPLLTALLGPGLIIAGHAKAQIVSVDESALARTGLFARTRNVSVRQRPHPEYAAKGVHLGAFEILPILDSTVEYNDNIFAAPSATKSDTIFRVTPAVSATSRWSRHQITAFAKGTLNEYSSHSSENTTDYALGFSGRLDATRNSGLAAGASYERDTEARTDPNSPLLSIHPIKYDVASGFIGAAQAFNRLRLSARADIQDFSYENGQAVGGGTLYERDRDHTVVTATSRGEYAVSPSTSIFGNVVFNHQQYRDQLINDISRTSSGYELTVGTNFDFSHLVRGEVYIGYLEQNYDDSRYKSVSGVSVRGVVEYFPTQLTTLTLTGARSVQDSVIIGAGGYLESNIGLQLDHELLRNVILTANVNDEIDDYSGISRMDTHSGQSFGAIYLMNRAISLNITYQHLTNRSSGSLRGLDFDVNRVVGGLSLRF